MHKSLSDSSTLLSDPAYFGVDKAYFGVDKSSYFTCIHTIIGNSLDHIILFFPTVPYCVA